MVSPNSLKRTYDATELGTPLPSQQYNDSLAMEPCSDNGVIAKSTQSDTDSSLSVPETSDTLSVVPRSMSPTSMDGPVIPAGTCTSATTSPRKRKRLTFEEREVQKIEKQFKEQQKAEEKARKEAEKHARDEARRLNEEHLMAVRKQKEEEKEEKRKLKEAEKQLKEAERQAREKEKEKKERASGHDIGYVLVLIVH